MKVEEVECQQKTATAGKAPKASHREWVGLAVIALP
jgi:hypothetical protein